MENTREAIDRLIEIGGKLEKPEVMEVDGRTYLTKNLAPVREPEPVALEVSTLTALVDYLKANVDDLTKEAIIVQVDGPSGVFVRSALAGDFMQRRCFMQAAPILPSYRFDHWLSTDTFIPILQSTFKPEGDRDTLLQLVAGVRIQSSADLTDNGITQTVTARRGIERLGQAEIPSPCTLTPFSTFLEVEQPARLFVFRMRDNGDGGVDCTLIDADGGAWKQAAAVKVRDYLRKELGEGFTVIA